MDRQQSGGGPLETSKKIVSAVMALIYIGVGAYVLVNPNVGTLISPSLKTPLGILLIAYGLFRGARFFKS